MIRTKTKTFPLLVVFAIAASVLVFAAERGTPAEAKAMLQKAVAHYKEVGRKQALADFNAKKPPFGDRDLYVFCIGPDLTIVANGLQIITFWSCRRAEIRLRTQRPARRLGGNKG